LEEGGFVSSEILVEGSAATRAADAYSVPNLDTAQWYNAIQGTILCDFALTGESASLGQHIWNIHDGTGTNNMILLKQNGGDLSQAYVEGTGGSNGPDITGNDKHKTAFGYKSAENNFYQNGTEIGGTSFKAEVINETQTTLTLGNSPVGNRAFYGLIFNLTYFPRRLSNPDLIDLTA